MSGTAALLWTPRFFLFFRFFLFHRESYCGLPGVCFWGFGFELGRPTMEFPVFVLGLSVSGFGFEV